MTIFAFIAVSLLLAKIVLMLDRRVPSDIIGLGIIAVLLITGTLSTTDALGSFSNESVVLVGALSIVVAGLVFSGAAGWVTEHMFKGCQRFGQVLSRLLIPVAAFSMFMIAEAVVAVFIHVMRIVGRRLGIPPSKILLPLSCAAALGSMCSLLGSPANLVVANFYRQSVQGQSMDIFAPFLPGIICAAVGIASLLVLQHRLPTRKAPEESFADSADYTVELLVPTDSHVVGETIADCGLDNVQGGHLIEIVRFDREVISPVPQDEFLLGGDHLVFAGQINAILDLRRSHGLVNATHHVFSVNELSGKKRHLQIVTLESGSNLVGHSMSATDFEERWGVVLIAITRQGQRLGGIPREEVLHTGDTLLFEGARLQPEYFRGQMHFFDSEQLVSSDSWKSVVASGVLVLLVALSMFEVMPLLHSCVLGAMLMVLTRCCSMKQAQDAINWKLLMVFAGSVCLGKALDVTGVATLIGTGVSALCGDSALGALIMIATLTTFVTQFIGNPLVAAVITPIALSTASLLGANPMTFCISVLIATNSAFTTPISSNANILIYGPGGYRFTDFMPVGIPLALITLAVNIVVVNLFYPLY